MSWNYRVLRKDVDYDAETYQIHSIHEVYYDEHGNIESWTTNAITLDGFESFRDGYESLKLIQKAFEKPVLIERTDENGKEYLEDIVVFNQPQQ